MNIEEMIKMLRNLHVEAPLNISITKKPDSDSAAVKIEGAGIDIIAGTVCLVDQVVNTVAKDLSMKLAFRHLIISEINHSITRTIEGEKPREQEPLEGMDPETIAAVFGKIFG